MGKQKIEWVCQECGHTQAKWSGNCSACQRWNTFEEMLQTKAVNRRHESTSFLAPKPTLIQDVPQGSFRRLKTGYHEFDRLMGGGVVLGSLTLIGGDPGIGKSTLMLQLSASFAKNKLIVLYVCGEESTQQTSLRAQRLGITSESLYLYSETLFSQIKAQVDLIKPDILVVDSAQIVYKDEIPSAPGSVVQVREIALECMHIAKGQGVTTFLIGHVTKSGDLAGPKVLEHIVDTVLDFEGDRQHGYRILRTSKNRFGPTDDIALFQMQAHGLQEVLNPSMLFLEERMKEIPGSVIIATLEGSRALLVEVQALVSKTCYPSPSRKCSGIDQNKLSLLLAVLEKKLHYPLYSQDVFVSMAGGIRLQEPGGDLGILLAIASSFCNLAIPSDVVIMGEVTLSGGIRSIPRAEARVKEALHMGFSTCVLPKKCIEGINKEIKEKIRLVGIDHLEEAIRHFLG